MPAASTSTARPSPTPGSPASSTATPTRKAPHCRTCHRPRKGHPARGCPYAEIVSVESMSSPYASDDDERIPTTSKSVVKSTSSKSPPPVPPKPTPRIPLRAKGPGRNESTPPPYEDPTPPKSTSTKKAPAKPTSSFKVWKDSDSPTPPETPPKVLRSTTKASSSREITTAPPACSKPKIPPPPTLPKDSTYEISAIPSKSKTKSPTAPPTSRAAARSAFVADLAEQTGASIHFVPSPRAKKIEKEAHELGLVTECFVDEGSDEALLIVGRCQFAVDRFLQMGGHRRPPKPFSATSRLSGGTVKGRTSV